ncbi:hypothetical protein PUN28_003943 [Cardiocondyla obscurior]|uniref:Uncharacterized protein n=1 Tax=Cardiocondyla obscurior TaxID=286306 RepID=A0AAW2GL02_9HYME
MTAISTIRHYRSCSNRSMRRSRRDLWRKCSGERLNEVEKGRRETSLPTRRFVEEASTSFSPFLREPVSTVFAWLK